jgi:type VII secretion-associated serine protease mycosin
MVTSMHLRISRARPPVLGGRAAAVLAAATVVLLAGVGAPAPAHAQGLATSCRVPAAPAATITAVPWIQTHYDLAAVSRITEGAGTTIAVIDSGVDATNPHLANAVRAGGDLLDRAGNGADDCVGHGTAVASIIAARPVAGVGLRGVAPAATILALRVSERIETENGTPSGIGNVQALIDGVRLAVAARPKPHVINLSISTATDDPGLRAVIQSALDADIVVVAAVGNQYERGNPTPYPASYDGVIGVGAVDERGVRVATSQTGPFVDIVAPGEAIIAAAPRAGHGVYTGTSFATPVVAATAALIRSRWPDLSRSEVEYRLLATADPAAGGQPSRDYGYGTVNPLRALTEVVLPSGGDAAPPGPVLDLIPTEPDHAPGPAGLAVGATTILLGAALIVAVLAATAPLGRRRRWRPGTVRVPPAETARD